MFLQYNINLKKILVYGELKKSLNLTLVVKFITSQKIKVNPIWFDFQNLS